MAKGPVVRAEDAGLPSKVTCPFCGGNDTALHNVFGPQPSVATYWCNRCRSPFEVFRRVRRSAS